jgi:hypothetical protein
MPPYPRDKSDKYVKSFTDMGIDGRIDLLLMFYADNKYKHKITTEQHEILQYVFSGYYPRLTPESNKKHREPRLTQETLEIMEAEGLIQVVSEMPAIEYAPTSKGYRINEKGGWLKHLEREKIIADNKEADRVLAASVSESVKWTNKVQIVSAITTVAIIGLTLSAQYQNNAIQNESLMLQHKQLQQDSLQSLSRSIEQEKEIDYHNAIDSLRQSLDGIKKQLHYETSKQKLK